MYKKANNATDASGRMTTPLLAEQQERCRDHTAAVAKRDQARGQKQGTIEKRACSFAVRKLDEALAMIVAAHTCHEGIYRACVHNLLDLGELDQLPPEAQSLLAEFLKPLIPESGSNRVDQVLATVASLTESEALQFVDDLSCLRQRLQDIHLSLPEDRPLDQQAHQSQ